MEIVAKLKGNELEKSESLFPVVMRMCRREFAPEWMQPFLSKFKSTTKAQVHARLGLPLCNGRFGGRTQRKSLCPCMIF